MLLMALMAQAALAWPNKIVHSEEIGAAVEDVVASNDGESVGVLAGGAVAVMSIDDWTVTAASPCAVTAGIAADPQNESGFVAGCSDGALAWFEIEGGQMVTTSATVDVGDQTLLGLAANQTFVFGLVENPIRNGNPLIAAYNTDTATVVTNGYPSYLWQRSVQDLEAGDLFLVASHGGMNLSKVAVGTGAASQQLNSPFDAETSDVIRVGTRRFMVAAGEAGVLEFQTDSNGVIVLLAEGNGIEDATAIAASESGAWFAIADAGAGSVFFHAMDGASGTPQATRLGSVELPEGTQAVREFGVADGYVVAGTDGGGIHLMTERPWVEITRSIPSNALSGDEVTITFTSDEPGRWSIRRGATSNTGGTVVASGDISDGEAVSATVVVDDDFAEGENLLRVVVEDDDGQTGHDTTSVAVDNPPSQVRLTPRHVGFGDGRIVVDIDGIQDEDLSHYVVFVSSVPFSAEAHPSGGPDFEGAPDDPTSSSLKLPRKIVADPNEEKTVTIQPLSNGATYFVAVRAYDAAGQEGPMSDVVNETPRETYGAADLAGETGGYACSAASGSAGGLLALCGLLMAATRRRAHGLVALGVLGVALPVHASDSEWPQSGNELADFLGGSFEARYSSLELADENLTQVFGTDGHNALWLEVGPTFFDLVELTGALGYYSETGSRVDADGNKSAEDDTMLAIPLTVDATFRLDVLPEQLIVPFVGIGYDYWLWQESWTGGNKVQGAKKGTHTTMGAHLLLDLFQPQRASRLQASSGITDTYVTVEYRQQIVGEAADGLTFTADVVSVGLKLDY